MAPAGAGPLDLDDDPSFGAGELPAPGQQAGGVAADADGAVEQEAGGPPALVGQGTEEVGFQDGGAPPAGGGERRGRGVDAERGHPFGGQADHQPSGSAAEVEHGPGDRAHEHVPFLGRRGRVPAGLVEDERLAGVGVQDDGAGLRRRPAGWNSAEGGRAAAGRGGRGGGHQATRASAGGAGRVPGRRPGGRCGWRGRPSTTAGRSSTVSRSTMVGSRATSRPRARRRACWARPVPVGAHGDAPEGVRAWGRRRPRAHHPPSTAWPRAAPAESSVARAWSRSAPVTWGVSMPICTPGPPAVAQAWARRRPKLPPHWAKTSKPGGEPRSGGAVEGEQQPVGAGRGHRLEGVGQGRLGQGGGLGRGARGAQPGLRPARARAPWPSPGGARDRLLRRCARRRGTARRTGGHPPLHCGRHRVPSAIWDQRSLVGVRHRTPER